MSRNTVTGKMTTTMRGGGSPRVKRETSKWVLRPANHAEVHSSIMRGLARVEEVVRASAGFERPMADNVTRSLSSAVGYGLSTNDLPALEQMMESGELVFTNWRFVFSMRGSQSNVTGGSSATNITPEMIDLQPHFPNPAASVGGLSASETPSRQEPSGDGFSADTRQGDECADRRLIVVIAVLLLAGLITVAVKARKLRKTEDRVSPPI